MKNKISEGKAEFLASSANIVSKKLEVFYNPVMKFNRDVTIALVNAYFDKDIKASLPLAGSGIRGLRMFLECSNIKEIYFNDVSSNAIKTIKKNCRKFKNKKIFKKKAQSFLIEEGPFDYIDIDPFGSSITFIDSAVNALYKDGILAITNTDTAALCGSYPEVCRRRYGAKPFNHSLRQEFGLRILIKRVQEIACMHDVALIPIYSYSKDHYMRVFFKTKKSKKECSEILNQHKMVKEDKFRLISEGNELGPIWTGKLWDKNLISEMKLEDKTAEIIKEECKIDSLFFVDPHELCKILKKNVPSYEKIFEKIEKAKYKVSRTHFLDTGIKTNMPKEKFVKLLKKK